MKADRNYFKATSFLDLLFNTLLVFFVMFVLAFVSIKIEQSKLTVESKAEFIITLTWDSNSKDDVDIWVREPTGAIVYFHNKSEGMTHLDRDDLGTKNDRVRLPDGRLIEYQFNQEIVTIRGVIPGEWAINVHMYAKNDAEPVKVSVKMDRINPVVINVFTKELTMGRSSEEITIARITLSDKGEILNMNEVPVSLIVNKIVHTGSL